MTSRLVLFVQEFNVEVDNILYFLVQDGVFKYNGSMFQQIMVSGTNIERFRRLMELVPKRENQQRKLLRAITSTDTFIRDREHFVKCFSKPPNPLHTNNILGKSHILHAVVCCLAPVSVCACMCVCVRACMHACTGMLVMCMPFLKAGVTVFTYWLLGQIGKTYSS